MDAKALGSIIDGAERRALPSTDPVAFLRQIIDLVQTMPMNAAELSWELRASEARVMEAIGVLKARGVVEGDDKIGTSDLMRRIAARLSA